MAARQHVPGLDGLRGTAAMLVLTSHVLPFSCNLGPFGVEIFFALSGFLNGQILSATLDRPETRPVSSFYWKRAARILPLYFAIVGTIVGTELLRPHGPSVKALWEMLTLNGDIAYAIHDLDRISTGALWTIGVEVHAYLLLPWIIRQRRGLLMLLIAGPLFRAVTFRAMGADASYTLTPGRIDGILWGAYAVSWAAERPQLVAALVRWTPWMLAARFVLGFIPFARLGLAYDLILQPLGIFGAIGLILSFAGGRWQRWASVFTWRLPAWIGLISYGVYLIHPLAVETYDFLRPHSSSLIRAAFVLVTTIVAARISWLIFEKPILDATARWLSSRKLAAPAGTAGLAIDGTPPA